jgi:DNA primase
MITNKDDIIRGVDIVALISRYMPLTRNGAGYTANCRWHQSKTGASFRVNPERQDWRCWGCDIGGDALAFIARWNNLDLRTDFVEALELLAAETGQRVEYSTDTAPAADAAADTRTTRQSLYDAASAAAAWYATALAAEPRALTYLQARGFTPDLVTEWSLGYARGAAVAECGADPDILVAAGILGRPERAAVGRELYDPLSSRLIIPLHDSYGRTVAFAGRALNPEQQPKYKNTHDTPIFRKADLLYGYHRAANLSRGATGPVYLLEGQLKAIAAIAAGNPAVAPGGTGLAPRQIALLARLDRPIAVVPDPDAAGAKAALRRIELLRAEGLRCEIAITVPADGGVVLKDPDDYLAAGRPWTFTRQSWIPWALASMVPGDEGSADWAAGIGQVILPVLNANPDPLVISADLHQLAALTGLAEHDLRRARIEPRPAPAPRPAPLADAPVDTNMNPARVLVALALQLPIDPAAPNAWSRLLDWTTYPVDLLAWLTDVAAVRRCAAARRLPVAAAIRNIIADPRRAAQYTWWSGFRLPDLTPEALQRCEARIQRPRTIAEHKETATCRIASPTTP